MSTLSLRLSANGIEFAAGRRFDPSAIPHYRAAVAGPAGVELVEILASVADDVQDGAKDLILDVGDALDLDDGRGHESPCGRARRQGPPNGSGRSGH